MNELTGEVTLGYSPCPNDTFIFFGLVHGRVGLGGISFQETLLDVETLNQMALRGELDVTKLSFHAFGLVRDSYCLLRIGAALGRGCGPLVVSNSKKSIDELKGKRIAIPGSLTTAYLLLRLYDPSFTDVVVMTFDRIMGAVSSGEADAGLIIHEGRFTYPRYGLSEVMDLGDWWEKETGLPIPLGCIAARRDMGSDRIGRIESSIGESLGYARAHPEECMPYIKTHAQELDDKVIRDHIDLYVNDFSLDIGTEGVGAVQALLKMAEERGIVAPSSEPLFMEG